MNTTTGKVLVWSHGDRERKDIYQCYRCAVTGDANATDYRDFLNTFSMSLSDRIEIMRKAVRKLREEDEVKT